MKIAICVPVYGDTKNAFTCSLARMLLHTAKVLPELELGYFTASASIVAEVRNWLIDEARDFGADVVLWMDSDHTFPANAIERLLQLRPTLPPGSVIGCNYIRRHAPFQPTAVNGKGLVTTTEQHAEQGTVEKVSSLGLGFCMMDLAALDLPAPVFRYTYDNSTLTGEDHALFDQLRERGVGIYVDHWLSWHLGHIGERVLTHRDMGDSSGAHTVLNPRGDR